MPTTSSTSTCSARTTGSTCFARISRRTCRMRADWRELATGAPDLDASRGRIVVRLPNPRSHAVSVSESVDGYSLEAVIAGRHATSRIDAAAIKAWRRNRSSRVVGYRIDRRGRLVAHAWSSRAGITQELFQTIVRALARE